MLESEPQFTDTLTLMAEKRATELLAIDLVKVRSRCFGSSALRARALGSSNLMGQLTPRRTFIDDAENSRPSGKTLQNLGYCLYRRKDRAKKLGHTIGPVPALTIVIWVAPASPQPSSCGRTII
jgi:hypothetical protein